MRSISRFESNLVRILQCFLGHTSLEQVLRAIERPMSRPACLSRDAVELVQHSLAAGTVTLLTRGGGWARQRHLRGDQIREGSLWQRSQQQDLGLKFSSASLDFLIWFTAKKVDAETAFWVPPTRQQLSLGDEFLLYLAARALRQWTTSHHWYNSEIVRSNALIALTMPDRFAALGVVPESDFDRWMIDPGAAVLEAMQDDLAGRWLALERGKCRISEPEMMAQMGGAQESILNQLLDAAEKHGRRDLCRFLLETLDRLLNARSHRDQWIALLATDEMRLAERAELYQRASAFLRTCRRLRKWQTDSVGVGYFDEGYAESQLWKSLWESTTADESLGHADRIISDLSF